MNEISLESMQPDDWEQVAAIYREGIDTSDATFETTVPSFALWDRTHLATPRLVARREHTILGWAALSHVSQRSAYAGVAEVSVYVASGSRSLGIGRQLLEALIEKSERIGIWTLQAGIFPENIASIRLHLTCGFREVGRRERISKLNGVWRDTILLERRSAEVGLH